MPQVRCVMQLFPHRLVKKVNKKSSKETVESWGVQEQRGIIKRRTALTGFHLGKMRLGKRQGSSYSMSRQPAWNSEKRNQNSYSSRSLAWLPAAADLRPGLWLLSLSAFYKQRWLFISHSRRNWVLHSSFSFWTYFPITVPRRTIGSVPLPSPLTSVSAESKHQPINLKLACIGKHPKT